MIHRTGLTHYRSVFQISHASFSTRFTRATLSERSAVFAVMPYLSVCLSHAGIVSKRLNLSENVLNIW